MSDRNELTVSVSKQIDGSYAINAMYAGPEGARPVFPHSTDGDVIMLRTWDEPNTSSSDNGRYRALSAHDLWLVAQIMRSGTKKRAADLAAQLAGLAERP